MSSSAPSYSGGVTQHGGLKTPATPDDKSPTEASNSSGMVLFRARALANRPTCRSHTLPPLLSLCKTAWKLDLTKLSHFSRIFVTSPPKKHVRLVSAKAERPNHPSRGGGVSQPARGGSQPAGGGGVGGPPHQ